MTDNNNPQPLTHMTDSVTPQPTPQDYLINAQSRIEDIYNATLKAMRDIEEAKASLPSGPNMETNMKDLIAFVWSKAIEYANDVVEDRMGEEVEISVEVDDTFYGDLDIRVSGRIDQDVIIGDHFSVHIHETFDGVAERHDEILQEFLKRQVAVSVTAEPVETSINLTKNNA
jgi:hypothetical protein